MRIDVHAHFIPPSLPAFAAATGDARWPVVRLGSGPDELAHVILENAVYRSIDRSYHSVRHRIDRMDRLGIDLQVISPLPVLLPHWATADIADRWCRELNRAIADAVAASDGRLLGFAILPTQSAELAIAAWHDASDLGLIGVELGTALDDDRLLVDSSIDALMHELASDDVPVLVHPNRRNVMGTLPPPFERGLAWPTDTAVSFGPRLLRHEILGLHPRTCLSHGGGTLVWEWTRIFGSGRDALQPPPWLYVDTAGCGRAHLRFLIEVLGEQAVVFGTDQPASNDASIADTITALAGWDATSAYSNARRFLGSRFRSDGN